MNREIVFNHGKWTLAENIKIATSFEVGTCFTGEEVTPQIGDNVFMDCSDNGFADSITAMGFVLELKGNRGRNQAFYTIKNPVCICELEDKDLESVVTGHLNDCGFFCCPHYGNTCGTCNKD